MPIRRFSIPGHATKQEFAVYAVVARKIGSTDFFVYVGKTGDNRAGCNPVISRAGNHFSYNDVHSQVRTKLAPSLPHEFDFEYFYVAFNAYAEDDHDLRAKIDTINEMERAANVAICQVLPEQLRHRLLNRYKATGYVAATERQKRSGLRTAEHVQKIEALAAAVSAFVATIDPGAANPAVQGTLRDKSAQRP